MRTGYPVSIAMTKKPVVVSPSTPISECAKKMAAKHVGGLMVTEKKKVLGILTEQDIVRKLIAKGKDVRKATADNVMEESIYTISPDDDIYEALIKMRDLNIRHLPVVFRNEIVGLLTLKDILKIEPQLFDLLVERFEVKEEQDKPIFSRRSGECASCGEPSDDLEEVDGMMLCEKCRLDE